MNPEKWLKGLVFIGIIAFLFLTIMVPVYAERGDLSENATILVAFLFVSIPLCVVGAAAALKMREKLAVLPVVLGTVVLHVGVLIIMGLEWGNEDCSESLFALCSANTSNFLLVLLIDTMVQLVFVYQYSILWRFWCILIEEARPKPVPIIEGEEIEDGGNF